MFDKLSEKLTQVFQKLTGRGRLSEGDLNEAMREVRRALLEADVNYKVVKDFLATVTEKALGQEILKSLSPGQQVIKIVNDELTAMMGGGHTGLDFSGRPPWPIMLVGLQGSGKTTTAGKLALYLKKQGKNPYLVPADVARPAAIIQLTRLGQELNVPVYPSTVEMRPVDIAKAALSAAGGAGADTVIIDTAGRLSIDQELMTELADIKAATLSREILLVADAMTGQEAVTIASDFNRFLDLSGVILSKMEGDARGGAAMSIRAVIDKPLKFIGVGEKLEALEPFHPDRIASLILGMGDVLTLIEKAQEQVDEEEAEKLAKKLEKGDFNLEDFRKQMVNLKKIGSVESILGMMPGLGRLKKMSQAQPSQKELTKLEAIINSMTFRERREAHIIDASRRRRIAMGSGTTVADVNKLLRNYGDMKKLIRNFNRGGFLDAIKSKLL
jgi:signal recognition particle subunit SRP54